MAHPTDADDDATDSGEDAPDLQDRGEVTGNPGETTRDRPTVAGIPVSPRDLAVVYGKGLFMGAADTVPGVSGGTIALVTGIYERLIAAITAVDPLDARHLLRAHTADGRRAIRDAVVRVDAPFLVALGLGILTAVASIAQVIEVVAEEHPAALSAFFFGLIAASAVVLYGEVDLASPRRALVAVAGVVLAVSITGVTGNAVAHSPPIVFLAGAVAVCAMVLPGVSGAFLLLVLGQYEHMIGRLNAFVDGLVGLTSGGSLDAVVRPAGDVVVFVTGAVVGLLTVAHAIRWALANYRRATLTFLVSLMVGGLRLPAENVLETATFTVGGMVPVALAALVGAVGVLLFDRYTDDLDYGDDPA